jgi:hypothetical protein
MEMRKGTDSIILRIRIKLKLIQEGALAERLSTVYGDFRDFLYFSKDRFVAKSIPFLGRDFPY